MRVSMCAAALLLALPATAAPREEVNDASADASADARDEGGAFIVTIVDGSGRGVFGARVTVDDRMTAATDVEGVARLALGPGRHHVALRVGDVTGALTFDVRAGGETELVVTVNAGALAFDVDPWTPAPAGPDGDDPDAARPDGEGSDATAAAAAVRRSLSGTLRSSETGEPVQGARLYVRGTGASAQSDAAGRFTLELPADAADVVIIDARFTPQTLQVPPDMQQVDLRLEPAVAALGDVVVTIPKPDLGTLETQLVERREAAAVTDGVGLEEMRKTADSTASTATRRIVGATVVGGAYLNVRGLGGRYTHVRLNGVTLPSTDPDLPGFQIDLFPVSLLTGLVVSKTFTPDIPGDFAGGSMNVMTRDYPERFTVSANIGLNARHDTLLQETLSYDGGLLDGIGVDDGTRALPALVPADQKVAGGRTGMPRAEVNTVARAFPATWSLLTSPALPDASLGLSVGDSMGVGAEGRLGYFLTLAYRSTTQRTIEELANVKTEGEGSKVRLLLRERLSREVGARQGQLGLLGSVSWRLNPHDLLRSTTLVTATGDDEAARTTGLSEEEGAAIERSQMTFVQRRLVFQQLQGRHDDLWGDLDVMWQVNGASVARGQPDTRNLLYVQGPDGFVYRNVTGSGERLYTALDQLDLGAGVDVAHPLLGSGSWKAGVLARGSQRTFQARRFGTRFVGESPELRLLPPDVLFAPESYGPVLEMEEVTRPDDGYEASETLGATYAMVDVPMDVPVLGALRLVGGARAELFSQAIASKAPFPVQESSSGSRADVDILPSLGLIYAPIEQLAVRASYGGTVARPLVRELAPFLNQDFIRRRNVQGNPDLGRTYIHSFDLRCEFFPGAEEVLALSGFYKVFDAPIESVVLDFRGNISFVNIERAQNSGLELEARFGLSRLSPWLADVTVMGNFALIASSVTLSAEEQRLATSAQRPLAGQSPFVANLSLSYSPDVTGLSFNVFYNVFGRRIQDVGRLGLPDVYEEPFHSLDATVFWKLAKGWTTSFFARNLLNQAAVIEQGGLPFLRSNQGVTMGARLSWELQ